ncbi:MULTISPECIES: hypothetical protein [Wolbachia]|uniref:hypothetical protein n=1 Tax=Wolbachia TaxID=953 RepID=UPI0009809E84|nr:hypothetical protein [Wolbachia pipientis]ONI57876.1 hypothetical protein N499_0461 [Wolbachia pipientis wVitA]
MTASIEFKNGTNVPISFLKDIQTIILSDGSGNRYSLDTSEGELKLKYAQHNQFESEYKVSGLVEALGSLLSMKSGRYDDSGNEVTVLAEKVIEKPIVEAILYAKGDDNNRISDTVLAHTFARRDDISSYLKSALEKKANKSELDKKADANNVYSMKQIDGKLEAKVGTCDVYFKEDIEKKLGTKANIDNVYDKAEVDNQLLMKANTFEVYKKPEANEKFFPLAEHGGLAKDILNKRTDNGGSILVETLGKFLDEEYPWYGYDRNQKARDFLADKGKFAKVDDSNIKIPDLKDKILSPTGGDEERSIPVEKLVGCLDQVYGKEKTYDSEVERNFLEELVIQSPKDTDKVRELEDRNVIELAPGLTDQKLISDEVNRLKRVILDSVDNLNNIKVAMQKCLGDNMDYQRLIAGDLALQTTMFTGENKIESVNKTIDYHGITDRIPNAIEDTKPVQGTVEDYSNQNEIDLLDNTTISTKLLADRNQVSVNESGNASVEGLEIPDVKESTIEKGKELILKEKSEIFSGSSNHDMKRKEDGNFTEDFTNMVISDNLISDTGAREAASQQTLNTLDDYNILPSPDLC